MKMYPKMQTSQDGGRSPCWKLLYHHFSEKSSGFDEIWYTAADLEPNEQGQPHDQKTKIQDGRRSSYWIVFGHNSARF